MMMTEINMLQRVLKNRETQLVTGNRNRRVLAIGAPANEPDQIPQAIFRDPVISDPKVRTAPRRVGALKFGICIACEGDISPKRLTALPGTARCIGCQEGLERKRPEAEHDRSFVAA